MLYTKRTDRENNFRNKNNKIFTQVVIYISFDSDIASIEKLLISREIIQKQNNLQY